MVKPKGDVQNSPIVSDSDQIESSEIRSFESLVALLFLVFGLPHITQTQSKYHCPRLHFERSDCGKKFGAVCTLPAFDFVLATMRSCMSDQVFSRTFVILHVLLKKAQVTACQALRAWLMSFHGDTAHDLIIHL